MVAGAIGVLNLQGDVREHTAALHDVGADVRLIKRPADLDGLAGLVLPGGESTTLSMLLSSTGLFDPLASLIADGLPVLGTCAGLVLLATEVLDGRPDQRFFSALSATVRRNGFGRQLQSFEADLEMELGGGGLGGDPLGGGPLPAVFIRAPFVVSVGPEVDVLATVTRPLPHAGAGPHATPAAPSPVLLRQGRILAASFHPELTPDRRIHALFAAMCV